MGNNGKSKWPQVPNDYSTQPINKQLLLTKATSEAIIKHLMNGPDNRARESVPKATVEAILRMVSSVMDKAIDQPDNKEILTEIRQLKQPIMRIEEDITVMKHSTNTVTTNNRQGPMEVWAKGLAVASPPISQSTMTSCFESGPESDSEAEPSPTDVSMSMSSLSIASSSSP
ncbi:MAG: hypothetical protein Q9161_000469 [Pseudevernia consocians]